ncbi:MAG: hypothetical protein JO352_29970 [Chloroflexi bacterium]|nr:hypothetical protein [Chloroflexota bacterium]MBV9600840.1 hypothetical protein [Chloroflexota bacterium]
MRPATINRRLVSLKRYFGWAVEKGFVPWDPSRVVKLMPPTPPPPRHLADREEREHVHHSHRSGHVSIYGKRNKYRQVPLNSTAATP